MPSTIPETNSARRDLRDVSEPPKNPKKRNSVSSRMRSALEAHVSRLRGVRKLLPEHTTRPTLRFGPERKPPDSMVSSSTLCLHAPIADVAKSKIAAQIFFKSQADWTKVSAAARTHEYVDQISATTCSSVDENRDSPASPQDSSEEDSGEETSATSSCDSCEVSAQGRQELGRLLEEKTGENVALQIANNEATARLQQSGENYRALQKKYNKQLDQRQNDRNTAEQAFLSYKAAEDRSEMLEKEVAFLQQENVALERRCEAQSLAERQHLTKLESDQRCANAVLESIHQKELAAKKDESQRARSLLVEKDQELNAAIKKASEERQLYAKASENRLRQVQKAAQINRKVMDEKDRALQDQINRLIGDYKYAIKDNEKKMTSLVDRNLQLEKVNDTMSQMLKKRFPDAEGLHEIIDDNYDGLKEEKDLRAQVKQMRELIENLLDKIQQMEGHYTKHQNAEQDARLEANYLQNQVFDRDDKIARQAKQIRDAARQWEQRNMIGGSTNTHFAGLDAIECQVEGLLKALHAERAAKTKVQKCADKYDAEALSVSIELGVTEAELVEAKIKIGLLQKTNRATEQEFEYLRVALQQNNDRGSVLKDGQSPRVWNSQAADEYKATIEENAHLKRELEELRKTHENIVDKHDSEVRKWKDMSEAWYGYYYNEAVATAVRLHDQVHELKAEKGETHCIESEQPRNPHVADRNAWRCADLHMNNEYEIPATYEALRELRPHGYLPHAIAGRVWLKREFVPLLEEEAARRIEIQAIRARLDRTCASSAVTTDTVVEPKLLASLLPMKGLIPTQVRKPLPAAAQPQRFVTEAVAKPAVHTKNIGARQPLGGLAQPTAQDIRPPPYESRFAEYDRRMTKDRYDDLEDENKMDFIRFYVDGGKR
jgi:hypothetical protein